MPALVTAIGGSGRTALRRDRVGLFGVGDRDAAQRLVDRR
jgi:hypothetical protein